MPRKGGIMLHAWTTAQRIDQLITRELKAAGVWTPHYALLSMIEIREPITPTALAQAMGLAPTTLSDRVGELVALGHVVRKPNPADGRSYLISTTAAGRRALVHARPVARRVNIEVDRQLGLRLRDVQAAIDDLAKAVESVLVARDIA